MTVLAVRGDADGTIGAGERQFDFLSMMVGVRRSSVTEAIHLLEGANLIKATRGNIRILDRDRLERAAGASYGVPEAEYRRLIGPL